MKLIFKPMTAEQIDQMEHPEAARLWGGIWEIDQEGQSDPETNPIREVFDQAIKADGNYTVPTLPDESGVNSGGQKSHKNKKIRR